MKLNYIKDLLAKHPYWKDLKNNNAVIEIAYKRLTELLDEIVYLNEDYTAPHKGQTFWGLTQFSYEYIEELLKNEPYLKELTKSQRAVIYQMASQKVANKFNLTTSDAYYVDSVRPGIIDINPSNNRSTLFQSIIKPALKLLTLWFDRTILNTTLRVYAVVKARVLRSSSLNTLLNVLITLKQIVVQGHVLNIALAVYLRIRDAFTKESILLTKLNVIVAIITSSFRRQTWLLAPLKPVLTLFTSLITEQKVTVGTRMGPTVKLK